MRARTAIAATTVLLLGLAACGSDDSDTAPAAAESSEPTTIADGADADLEADLDVEGMLEGTDQETLLRALGEGVSAGLPDAGSYAVAGSTLTVTMEAGSADADGDVACAIAGGAASAIGIGEDASLVLVYPDGDVVCEI